MTILTRWAVRVHKWLALIVGLQIILWIAGGFAMSLMPIDQVRGDHLRAPALNYAIDLEDLIDPAEAARIGEVGPMSAYALRRWHNGPVYQFETWRGPVVVSATSGERLTPITRAQAIDIAQAGYSGSSEIISVTYFERPSWEYRRDHPAFQVAFGDEQGARFYVAANTGQIDAVRTDMWRLYDFFWMLHIMDYEDREDFNHPLLISAAGLALITVLAGLTLLFVRVRRTVLVQLNARKR